MKFSRKMTNNNHATNKEPNPMRESSSPWYKKVIPRQKFRTKTLERESNPTSQPTSSAAGPSKTTSTSAEVAPSSSFQTQVSDNDRTRSVASDRPIQGATELSLDTKTPAAQESPELEPTVGTTVAEETEIFKMEDDPGSGQDDALFLLWNEAYDALPHDNVHKLPRIDSHRSPQILEDLLAEPDSSEDESGIESNRETELTGLSMFKNIIRDVALRESQRAAAVAWVTVCNTANALIKMSAPARLVSSQHLINIISAMEWYCTLPGLLPNQSASMNLENRTAILNLYKAIILYLERLPSLSTEENLRFPDTIVEKERAVMACFGRLSFRSRLDQLFESLATDTEAEHKADEPPVSATVSNIPEDLSYSFRDELPEAPEGRRGIQNLTYSWAKSTTVYAKFSSPDASDSERELWVVGKPGTGKSTLLEAIAQDLFRRQDHDDIKRETEPVAAYVAAFFCNRGKEREENAAAILQCLVLQVLERQTWLRQHFFAAYNAAKRRQFDRPEDLHVISAVFRAILGDDAFKPTYFVIDAIDECCNDEDEAETSRAVGALVDFVSGARRFTGVRWLISADSNSAIQRLAPRTDGANQKLELYLDGDSMSPTIGPTELTEPVMLSAAKEHIKLRVREVMSGMQVTESFREEAEDKMFEQSEGNFLWVDVACKQILSHGLPWNAIRFLDSKSASNEVLPSGLEPLYIHMEASLDKLQWESPHYCHEIINTLATAYKPLRLDELVEFLPNDAMFSNVDLATIIKKQCFAFLEVRDDRVFFAHQSAKIFFRNKMKDKAQRHSNMTLCCLKALSGRLEKSERAWKSEIKEFHHYSTWYWLKHLCKIDSEGVHRGTYDETIGETANFLKQHFFQWIETLAQSSVLAQILMQLLGLESILRKWTGESNDTVKRCLDQVQFSSRFIQFHTCTQSPPQVSPKNSLLFCPTLGENRSNLLHTTFPWLSSTLSVETTTSLVIEGHRDWVRSCAFSNDGRLLASASDDETIRFWDPLTGTLQATLTEFDSWPRCVRFSAGSPSLMATMESTAVKLWNISASFPSLSIQGSDVSNDFETASMLDISFSPDGKRLAVLMESEETVLAIWNVEKSEKQPVYHWRCDDATCVRYLASGGTSNSNVENDTAGTDQGGLLVTSCEHDRNSLVFWRESGKQVKRLEEFARGITTLAFCPSLKLLAVGSYFDVSMWKINPDDEEKLIEERAFQRKAASRVVSLAFSDDGSIFGVASRKKTIQIWRLDDKADPNPQEVMTGHPYGPLEISLFANHSGAWVASCSREGLIEITDLDDQNPPTANTTVLRHSKPVNTVLISPNGKLLATSSEDGVIQLWNGDTGDYARKISNDDNPLSLIFSHDGAALAGTFTSGVAKVWETRSGKITHDNLKHDDWVRGGAFSPPSVAKLQLATASDDWKIRVWNVDSQAPNNGKGGEPTVCKPLQVFEGHSDYAICVTFSPDGNYLASAGDDNAVYLWDNRRTTGPELETTSDIKPRRLDFRASRIRTVAFSPDGKRVVASAIDDGFRIWECESGSCIFQRVAPSFRSLRFSGDPDVDKGWILTEMGAVPVGDSVSSVALAHGEPWPALAPWSIDRERDWINYKGKGVIFLPGRYRPNSDAIFIQGSRVAIGCRSGLILFLRFNENGKLLKKYLNI